MFESAPQSLRTRSDKLPGIAISVPVTMTMISELVKEEGCNSAPFDEMITALEMKSLPLIVS